MLSCVISRLMILRCGFGIYTDGVSDCLVVAWFLMEIVIFALGAKNFQEAFSNRKALVYRLASKCSSVSKTHHWRTTTANIFECSIFNILPLIRTTQKSKRVHFKQKYSRDFEKSNRVGFHRTHKTYIHSIKLHVLFELSISL